MTATCCLRQLFAKLADENVDNFEFGLVNPAVQVVEKHLLGQSRAFAQAKQFEDAVFL
jgi:hypothetical protein